MQARKKIIFLSLSVMFLASSYIAIAFAAEIAIVGEVNDTYQIVTGNQIYEVAETPMGDDLVKNYIAEKVEVIGTVKEKDGMKIITVKSFKTMPE